MEYQPLTLILPPRSADRTNCPDCGEPGALQHLYRVVGLRFFGCTSCRCVAVLNPDGEPEFCLERAA